MKKILSKYIIHILVFLIVIVLILLILPSKTSDLTLTLKGDATISLLKGKQYVESGYIAFDSKDGDLTSFVTIVGGVNSDIVGTYTLTYYVTNSRGERKEVKRIVNVVEDLSGIKIEIDYSPKNLTNEDVTITLQISGDNYDFAFTPSGEFTRENTIKYQVKTNGEYLFSIKRKDGSVVEKNIKIENIDKTKPNGSCKSVVANNKTTVTVSASDSSGIKKYVYNLNGSKHESSSNNYSVNGSKKSVSVTIYDNANNYKTVSCNVGSSSTTWPISIKETNLSGSKPKNFVDSGFTYSLRYLLYYPDNTSLSNKNALIVFLHGSGSCGTTTDLMYTYHATFSKNIRDGKFKTSAVYLAPQCRCSDGWSSCTKDLKSLIDKIVVDYNIDPNRISISGHSTGGSEVYTMLEKYQNFFASAAILAPISSSTNYSALKNVKIVVFTGTSDDLYEKNKASVEYLAQNGVSIKFFPLQGVTHATQPPTFNKTNVIEWMVNQKKQ